MERICVQSRTLTGFGSAFSILFKCGEWYLPCRFLHAGYSCRIRCNYVHIRIDSQDRFSSKTGGNVWNAQTSNAHSTVACCAFMACLGQIKGCACPLTREMPVDFSSSVLFPIAFHQMAPVLCVWTYKYMRVRRFPADLMPTAPHDGTKWCPCMDCVLLPGFA